MNVSSPRFTVGCLAVLAACAAQEGVSYSDAFFPSFATFGDTGCYVRRLVDDLTGLPIAGAEVFLVTESRTPIAGEFWFTARGVSDADGFVRISVPIGKPQWHVQFARHAGHGATTGFGEEAPIWRMGRGFDVPVRVEDWRGAPVANALVGLCGACGHTPDLVNARTGADGVAVLRGIDPHNQIADLYVQQPGVSLGYDSLAWRPGDPPDVLRCSFAPAKSGRVIGHRGQPVAGAYVGALDVHRGPWARTAADGTFTVIGAPAKTDTHIVVMPERREIHFPDPSSYPVTMQLPDLADADAYQGTVQAAPAAPREPIALRTLRVVVHGAPGPVKVGGYTPELPHDMRPSLPGEIDVSATGPFVLSMWNEHGSREIAFDDAAALRDPLVVTWQPDVRVTGRAVDANGAPVAVSARWTSRWLAKQERDEPARVPFADGRFELSSSEQGTRLLELAPDRPELLVRRLWVTVPARGAQAQLDLGDVVLSNVPQLRVLGAVQGWTIGLARAGMQDVGQAFVWPLAADGAWLGPDLREGDTIVIEHEAVRVPFRQVLTGAGPWTVAPPEGVVELTVVDERGEPLHAQLVLDDFECEADGPLTLRGLRPGPHRLFITAPDHRTAIADTIVGDVPKALRVVLPRR